MKNSGKNEPRALSGGGSVVKLVQCALLAAMTAAATLISIPVFGGHGFVNPGDAVIHFSVFTLGGWYAVASAAVGSMLADIITGYAVYAPATFIIKGLVAFVGTKLALRFKRVQLAFILSGLLMPLGYFLYEMLLFSPAAALFDAPWNLLQYAVCAALGSLFVFIVNRGKSKT